MFVKSICFRQKQACVAVTTKAFHLRNDMMLLPPSVDMCLQCFFKLERQSYISVTLPSNYLIILSLLAAFLLVPLSLKCFYLASVKEIIVKISVLMQTDIFSSYKPFNVLQNSLEGSARWMSLFIFVAWGRNIQRWLFGACTSALCFYFSVLQCFLKNATTQGEHYFETFSRCHRITLLPSLQHSASSEKVAPADGSAAGKRKQPCFLGNSLLKRKGRWLLILWMSAPSCKTSVHGICWMTALLFFGVCGCLVVTQAHAREMWSGEET